MKIFSVPQIKAWDNHTIQNEPVSSVELMERAAMACSKWLLDHFNNSNSFIIFCGKGNNGGDGLAIARILIENNFKVIVYIAVNSETSTPDFEINLERLDKISNDIYFIEKPSSFPGISDEIVVDAMLGTGLNKSVTGLYRDLIAHINEYSKTVISVDVPSGLYIDKSTVGDPDAQIVKADFTLTFQNQKLAFLMPENQPFFGKATLLNIGLSKEFEEKENAPFEYVEETFINGIYKPRNAFSNKGNFGYACLLAGSYGMMGAAVLSCKACLRSGVGKLTCYTCEKGYEIMQSSVPESMCQTFGDTFIKDPKNFESFDVIGIGPGIGKKPSHKQLLQDLFSKYKNPLVIDADALNVISENPQLMEAMPVHSIITPHPKEFERLFGKSQSDFERIDLALQKAELHNIFIVLKGHRTFIATPKGKGYFNSTGNAGMATAGAGDVLTGIITALVAQKYSALHACILGVYLHGLAGDLAAETLSQEALIAEDIINHLGKGFIKISSHY